VQRDASTERSQPTYGTFGSGQPENNYALVPRRGKLHLLFVATDKYNSLPPLTSPIYDAHSLEQELMTSCVQADTVFKLENPTLQQIVETLKHFSEMNYDPEDQLLIFFFGRGVFDETTKEGFLAATDSTGLGPDRLFTTYLSAKQLAYLVDSIPAQHIMLILDAPFVRPAMPTR
jgi:hypothetical protein